MPRRPRYGDSGLEGIVARAAQSLQHVKRRRVDSVDNLPSGNEQWSAAYTSEESEIEAPEEERFEGHQPWQPSLDWQSLGLEQNEVESDQTDSEQGDFEATESWAMETSEHSTLPQEVCKKTDLFMIMSIWAATSSITVLDWAALWEVLQVLDLSSELPASRKSLMASLAKQLPTQTILEHRTIVNTHGMEPQGPASKVIYYFDMLAVLHSILDKPHLREKMYFGPALVDPSGSRSELWHGDAWAESIRAASGDLPRYPNSIQEAIFQSDCIEHQLGQHTIFGRVVRIWKVSDVFQLEIQRITKASPGAGYVLEESPTSLIPVAGVLRRLKFAYSNCDLQIPDDDRQVFGTIEEVYSAGQPRRSADRRLQILAEGELQHYGRIFMQRHFVDRGGDPIRCIPVLLFCDGFALYRTLWKSTMGYYICSANLPMDQRRLQSNWHTLAVSPFGSSLASVVGCLSVAGKKLAQGRLVEITGQPGQVKLAAFLLAGIGDMPQQAQSLALKSQNSLTPCQRCLITKEEMQDLRYDTVTNYRRAPLWIVATNC